MANWTGLRDLVAFAGGAMGLWSTWRGWRRERRDARSAAARRLRLRTTKMANGLRVAVRFHAEHMNEGMRAMVRLHGPSSAQLYEARDDKDWQPQHRGTDRLRLTLRADPDNPEDVVGAFLVVAIGGVSSAEVSVEVDGAASLRTLFRSELIPLAPLDE